MGILVYRVGYFFREAFKNIRHASFLTSVSVATIAVSLVLVGAFSFLLLNANRFLDQIARELRVSVYLAPEAAPSAIDELVLQLRERKGIESVRLVTRAEDRERSFQLLGPELLQGLDEESIPAQASLEITLEKRRLLKKDIEEIAAWLEELTLVDEVDETMFGADKLRVVHASIDLVRVAGLIISVILVLAAVFFTFSTVKLAIYARHEEIQILRLVGATNRFIRIPFYIEGFLQGLVGSLLAAGILAVLRSQLNRFVAEVHFLNLHFELLPAGSLLLFFVGGVALGFAGSALSIGRYLRG